MSVIDSIGTNSNSVPNLRPRAAFSSYKISEPKSLIILNGTKEGASTVKVSKTFTGEVFLDMIYGGDDVATANATFTPCARTHWHTHEKGQIIHVIQGAGWICDKGGEARIIKSGDVIWAPPGTTHWHGADDGTLMSHFVGGVGETKWLDEVTEEDYRKRSAQFSCKGKVKRATES